MRLRDGADRWALDAGLGGERGAGALAAEHYQAAGPDDAGEPASSTRRTHAGGAGAGAPAAAKLLVSRAAAAQALRDFDSKAADVAAAAGSAREPEAGSPTSTLDSHAVAEAVGTLAV